MHITEIKRSERKKDRILVKLDSGSLLRVTEEELLRFGLRTGMELGEEQLQALDASAKASSTKVTAANMISARPLSKKELQRRLVKKGAEEADAQAAADWLEDIGAVNDAAYAAALVRHYGGKGYGVARVKEELRHRGVPRELWEKALEELPDSSDILDALIRKKAREGLQDPREVKRVSDSLLRRGYSWGEVRSALSRYTEIEED